MTGRNLLGLAFRATGLGFAAIAVVAAAFTLAFVLRADALVGTVVDHSKTQNQISFMPRDQQTGILYYPVISYTPSGGGARTFTGPAGRPQPQFIVGDQVGVLVSRSDASQARLDTVLGVWGTPIVLGGLALIFLIIGLAAPLGFGGTKR